MRAQGGSDPQKLFGRLKAEKVGSLPPDLGHFRRCIFPSAEVFPCFLRTMPRHKGKAKRKARVQDVVLTFFTANSRFRPYVPRPV
jgi:hypothetical protein